MKFLIFTIVAALGLDCFAQNYSFDTRLTAFDKATGENYGTEVDLHETLMIVGTPNDGVTDGTTGGSAFIYEWSEEGWNLVTKIRSNDSILNVNFGAAVAISNDFAVVGDPSEADQGAAYIFERSGDSWSQVAKVEATVPTSNDQFGDDVEIDGNWIFIGAPNEEEGPAETDNVSLAGSVFVYNYNGDEWNFDHKLVPTDRTEDEAVSQRFGYSLAADNGYLMVSAYRRTEDGVGTDVGAVYFFEQFDDDSWVEKIMLRPADGEVGDFFGWDVDLQGGTAVVGALNHDYDLDGENFKGNSGAAYYLTFNEGDWLIGGKLVWSERDNSDYFGSSVALTPNEEKLIVGMYEDQNILVFDGETYNKSECGAAVVFDHTDDGNFVESERITPSIKATGDHFGNTMSATNTTLAVGVYLDDIELYPNEGLCNLDDMEDNGAVDLYILETTPGSTGEIDGPTWNIYPNPVSDFLIISAFENLEFFEILSFDGRIVNSGALINNQKIDVEDLQPGLYFIRVDYERSVPFIKY